MFSILYSSEMSTTFSKFFVYSASRRKQSQKLSLRLFHFSLPFLRQVVPQQVRRSIPFHAGAADGAAQNSSSETRLLYVCLVIYTVCRLPCRFKCRIAFSANLIIRRYGSRQTISESIESSFHTPFSFFMVAVMVSRLTGSSTENPCSGLPEIRLSQTGFVPAPPPSFGLHTAARCQIGSRPRRRTHCILHQNRKPSENPRSVQCIVFGRDFPRCNTAPRAKRMPSAVPCVPARSKTTGERSPTDNFCICVSIAPSNALCTFFASCARSETTAAPPVGKLRQPVRRPNRGSMLTDCSCTPSRKTPCPAHTI